MGSQRTLTCKLCSRRLLDPHLVTKVTPADFKSQRSHRSHPRLQMEQHWSVHVLRQSRRSWVHSYLVDGLINQALRHCSQQSWMPHDSQTPNAHRQLVTKSWQCLARRRWLELRRLHLVTKRLKTDQDILQPIAKLRNKWIGRKRESSFRHQLVEWWHSRCRWFRKKCRHVGYA